MELLKTFLQAFLLESFQKYSFIIMPWIYVEIQEENGIMLAKIITQNIL